MRRGGLNWQAWEVGLGPSVGLGAKGQLRAEEPAPSWVGVGVSGGAQPGDLLSKSICACPGQGTGAQLGVHTTARTFPRATRTPHPESLSEACPYCARGAGPWASAEQDELATCWHQSAGSARCSLGAVGLPR